MAKKLDYSLGGVNKVFREQQEAAGSKRIVSIPLDQLHQHPQLNVSVQDDAYLQELTESIKKNGILEEIRAFPDPDGGYWIISGRHRAAAAKLAGFEEVDCILDDDMSQETAEIAITDSNLRHDLSVMEKAWTYRIKRDAESRQGYRSDLHGKREKGESEESERNMLYLVIAIFVAFITFFIMWIKNGRKVDKDVAITSLSTALDFSATVLLFFVLFLNLGPYNKNFFTEEKVEETYSIKLEGGNAFIQQGSDWQFLRIPFDDYTFKEFLQSFAAISLEGLVIALAMIVFSAYAQSPIIELGNWGIFDWLGSAADEVSYMFTMIFNMLLLMGLIKGADQVVHQIFSR